MLRLIDGKIQNEDSPALSALNMRLRDDYVADCNVGVGRWNKVIERSAFRSRSSCRTSPSTATSASSRSIKADVDGNILSDAEWDEAARPIFCPPTADRDFIESLMQPQFEPAKFASWIAPPKVGIDNKPGDFEYVKIADA